MIGTSVSHYSLLERIAEGPRGGAVYKARDTELERLVALKLLPAGPGGVGTRQDDRRRLAYEAEIASALEHPNICPVYEVGETGDGRIFIAMAFCEGGSLAARIARGPLKLEVAVDLAAQIAAGLARAHERGIVHRGLKPSNVLVTPDGQARIVDFGIAVLDDRTRVTGDVGEDTPPPDGAYLAPEQLRGEPADFRSDLWALGTMLYEMISGRLPFPRGPLAAAGDPEPLSALRDGVPHELERVVGRLLARRPADRPHRAEDLRHDLRALGRTGTVSATAAQHGSWERAVRGGVPREVGPYHVGEVLGGGGMGLVYRAEDSRLGRTVALKFLPAELTRDPVSKARFLQEARTASALDHPNLCTVYDVGETDEHQLYLAMPCYDGETVRAKVERGPLPVDEALDYALQTARGLAKAHRQGIVHRDVKPANLMVTGDGVVKILDFGIAKLAGEAGLTRTGGSVGTPAYMSPEQMRGQSVDGRTDLWALGVVFYEMLAGRRPFLGDHESALRQSILGEEPEPLRSLRPDAPPEVERVVRRLLAKDPAERLPTADALVAELRLLAGTSSGSVLTQAVAAAPAPRRSRLLWIGAAAALAVLAAVAGTLLLRGGGGGSRAVPPRATFSRLTEQPGSETFPNLSPDGNYFVYVKSSDNADIYLQRVGGGNPINLTPGTAWDDTQPAFSPDGQQIAFRSERDGGGIFVMGATGESVRRLTDFGHNPAWSPDGRQIAVATEGVTEPWLRTSNSQVWIVDVATGDRRLVARGDGVQPSWSPDGRRIAYWGLASEGAERTIWTVPAAGGEPVAAIHDRFLNWNPVWAPDGSGLYFISDRSGSLNLWRIGVDPASGKVKGSPEPVTSSSQSIRFLSLSRDGRRIAYATDDRRNNLESVGFDPAALATVAAPATILEGTKAVRSANASPDGSWLVFDTLGPQEDLFVVRPDGSDLLQLTRDAHRDRIPRWSPDGRSILFYSDRSGRYEVWSVLPDGSRSEQLTRTTGESPAYPLWSPDGRTIACNLGPQGMALVDLSRPLAERTLKPLPGMDRAGGAFGATSWSTDGRWLAGTVTRQDLSPQPGIVLYSLETGRFRRLTDSGHTPFWLHHAPALLFLDGGKVFLYDLREEQAREVLAPPGQSIFRFVSASRDDRRLFLVRRTEEGDVWMLTLD